MGTLSTALQLQFCTEYDVKSLRDRILRNVHFDSTVKQVGQEHGIEEAIERHSLLKRQASNEFDVFKRRLESSLRKYETQRTVIKLGADSEGPIFQNEHIMHRYQDDMSIHESDLDNGTKSTAIKRKGSVSNVPSRGYTVKASMMVSPQGHDSIISKGASEVGSPLQNSSVSHGRDVATLFST